MKAISLTEIENQVSSIRHEMRSGLACMQGSFETLWEGKPATPDLLQLQTAGSQKIEAAISQLAKLSEKLLEVIRETKARQT
ncbi:hypothetical protein WDW37_20735 [Bdellovibrionota bacterium FG-1]